MIKLISAIIFRVKLYIANDYQLADLYRKKYGLKIGNNTRFTGKKTSFGSEPYLISIGDNVTITAGVRFVTHDGGVAIFRSELPGLNVFGKITIGNNVFIGDNSIILGNVTIGDNVVIGANSVVSKSIPSNVVAAGVPAKVIKSIFEYKEGVMKKSVIILEKDYLKRKAQILNYFETVKKEN